MGLLRTLGTIAGGAGGFLLGGPQGAAIGAGLGGGLGGTLEGPKVSEDPRLVQLLRGKGLGQFLRVARASSPTQAELAEITAARGLGRSASGAISGAQAEASRLQAGTRALDAFTSFQSQRLGILAQLQGQANQRALARHETRASFLNNIIGLGGSLAVSGGLDGLFDGGGGGLSADALAFINERTSDITSDIRGQMPVPNQINRIGRIAAMGL